MSTKDEQEILTLEHYLQLKAEGFEFEGQSYLFWEYMRLLNETKPKYFLLENVMMGEKWEKILSKAIGVKPIMINSALISAQNRQRLYWTNIGLAPAGLFGDLETTIELPKDKGILLKDVLESEVDSKYFLSEKVVNKIKSNNLVNSEIVCHNMQPRSGDPSKGGTGHLTRTDGKTYCLDTGQSNAVEYFGDIRRLTPIECERLQTVRDNYTNHVSDSQRYKMLGNGWTVDVIAHFFKYMK
jgi:DNA (cytosine-5)-methyltransferase 3A